MSFIFDFLADLLNGPDLLAESANPFASKDKKVQILNAPYTRWKAIAQSMGIATYHIYVGKAASQANHDYAQIYCGNQDWVIRTTLATSAAETTWASDFASSIQCVDEEEAIVAIVGNFFVTRKLGNTTAASVSEALVSSRAYVEQSSEAQRSMNSTSATDDDTPGSGARVVRITYLTSAYERKTTDVVLNGTANVNTDVSDIRFVESMQVIKGVAAVGALRLFSAINGGGSEFCGIAAGTHQTFMCHHYVPANTRCWVFGWGATVDDEASMKLLGQERPDGTNLVDTIIDLEKLFLSNPTPPTRIDFDRSLKGVLLPEKTYVRVTAVPNQATSTVIRARLDYWEVPA